MDVNDYLIDHSEFDWPQILSDWSWLLPDKLTVWLMNRFGDLFLVLDDGSVHMLDVGGGTLEQLADSQDDFCALCDDPDNAEELLMIPLVDELVAAGMTLGYGECYGYRMPPALGGEYTLENAHVLPIPEHFAFHAEIHEQLKDVPDGTEISIEFSDDDE